MRYCKICQDKNILFLSRVLPYIYAERKNIYIYKLFNYFTMNIKRNIQLFNNKENSTGITKLNNDNINELKIYCIEIEKSKTGKKSLKA